MIWEILLAVVIFGGFIIWVAKRNPDVRPMTEEQLQAQGYSLKEARREARAQRNEARNNRKTALQGIRTANSVFRTSRSILRKL